MVTPAPCSDSDFGMTNGISLFATLNPVCGEEIPNGRRVRHDGARRS